MRGSERDHGLPKALTALALVAVMLEATACASGGGPTVTGSPEPTTSVAPTSSVATSTVNATATAPSEGKPLADLRISLKKVGSGFSAPLYVTNAGDGSGRIFVVEQVGTIRTVAVGGRAASTPFLDLSSKVSYGGERGLLGLAFAPDYKTSGRFYVDYTDTSGNTVIERYVASPPSSSTPKISGRTRLLYIPQPFPNHNGGCLQFGLDGMLYIGMGDGGSAGDPGNRAQRLSVPLGKLLRIDVSGPKYSVPKDNPYAGQGYPENIIWARGLRNPWRFSFDAPTKTLWIADVGQDRWEEVDVVPASDRDLNFGWHLWEGTHPYPPGSPAHSKKGFVFPIVEYPHPTGESIAGGYVYRGTAYPAMSGTYFYADYVKGWIGAIRWPTPDRTTTKPQTKRLLDTSHGISSFGVDERGELYLTDLSGGGIYQVTGR